MTRAPSPIINRRNVSMTKRSVSAGILGFAVIAPAVMGSAIALSAPAQAAPARSITTAESARHGTSSDCWVISGRNVYDVTAYLPRHPGGAGEISPLCGGRATAAFNGEHRGDGDAARALATLKIGKLAR